MKTYRALICSLIALPLLTISQLLFAGTITFNGTQIWDNEATGSGQYFHDRTNIEFYSFELAADSYLSISIQADDPANAAHFDPTYRLFYQSSNNPQNTRDPLSFLEAGLYVLGVSSGSVTSDEWTEGGDYNYSAFPVTDYMLNDVAYTVVIGGEIATVSEPNLMAMSFLSLGGIFLGILRRRKIAKRA
ncbi:hypothetical protein [Teredinibacter sp. KSP-S5-2]|uniref:hypothetical protein n=1 Tax=Teredinibacter sp. KSP-S5-2 TaxID=3034506 RepID=UPI002934840C|nr:hypothetical protein [Teredinibacter sp. KSP-S5-2]WNO09374.1 hypothetical protein P5V12_20745 [Teredinibacter sp. KSP-S5-2]